MKNPKLTIKDSFTVRMNPDLYDLMQKKLRSGRKNKSINKYINELIEKDVKGETYEKI